MEGLTGVIGLIMDVETFFSQTRGELISLITRELTDLNSARVQTIAWIRFVQEFDDVVENDIVELAFNSRLKNLYRGSNSDALVDGMITHMKAQIENAALLSSRFRFNAVLFLDANFHRLNLTRGSSYLPLPDWIAKKKVIINPQNDDGECFKWSVTAASKWVDIKFHPECISKLRECENNYDWSGLKFPVSIKDIAYGEVENPLEFFRGEDCVEKFCNHIEEGAKRLCHMFAEKPMDPLTNEQWKRYKRASRCHICYKQFAGDKKVRDHCHYTGKYRDREPALTFCNLRYRIPSYIPVIFYKISGYDAHLFIRELGKKTNDIGVNAKNKEDYIAFSVDVAVDKYQDKDGNEKDKTIKLRFIESFKFMASSLDSLMSNLVKGERKLIGFEDYSEEQCELLIRKGIYLFEYMSSWDKFTETELPPKEAFYSNLNMSNISDDDYQHTQKAWKAFSIRNFGEYHNLYLKTDVILLANVFKALEIPA